MILEFILSLFPRQLAQYQKKLHHDYKLAIYLHISHGEIELSKLAGHIVVFMQVQSERAIQKQHSLLSLALLPADVLGRCANL